MAEHQYHVEPVTADDVDEVMRLLRTTFYVDEPLNQAVDICQNPEDSLPLDHYCTQSLLDGLSFKAVDSQGNIVGVTISGVIPLKEADDGNDLLSRAERCKNPKFKRILYILARRETARLWERYPQETEQVEVKIASTHPNWRRKGIMNALLARTESATKERGIRILRMDTSSAYSAASAERLGFTCVYRAAYKDIQMDGQPIIMPEPPHLYDCVYVKEMYPDGGRN